MRYVPVKLLVILAVGYGLIKGYLWYEVKQRADQVVAVASPFAEVSYGSIHTSMAGVVGLNDIVIRPNGTEDEFTIQELRLSAPNVIYFLKGQRRLGRGEVPEHMGLALKRVSIDLNSQMLRQIERMQLSKKSKNEDWLATIAVKGCGNRDSFSLDDLRKMGIKRLNLDLSVDLNHKAGRNIVKIHIADPDLFRFDMNARLQSASEEIKQNLDQGLVPTGTFKYRDTGWYKKRNPFCANETGSTPEEYVNRNLAYTSAALGLTLPKDAAEAYRKLMLEGGSLTVSLEPAETTPVAGLKYYAPKEIMPMLGMEVTINDVSVDENKIVWGVPKGPIEARIAQQSRENVPPKELLESLSKSEPKGRQFHLVSLQELANHIRQKVRLQTKDGRTREGRLRQVSGAKVEVLLRGPGGWITYSIDSGDILKAEVFY